MREIKFRAWDNNGKVMLSWDCIMQTAFNRGDYPLIYDLLAGNLSGGKWDMRLLQCTGLKDKNGKEIYEGDILQIIDSEDKTTITVGFHDGAFSVEIMADWGGFHKSLADFMYPNEWEIIGNIYENPELVEAK